VDEFSLLYYVGLQNENNHVPSDFPFTTDLTRPNPGYIYHKYFSDRIVAAYDELRDKLRKWIAQSESYQKLALKEIQRINQGLNN
jgi:hypothetical protein